VLCYTRCAAMLGQMAQTDCCLILYKMRHNISVVIR
jgi:hypothetical protein